MKQKTFHLIDYKSKATIIQDEELFDPTWEFIVGEITLDEALNQLEARVKWALYYGIPTYVGKNRKLKNRIARIIDKLYEQYEPSADENTVITG